MAVHVTCDRCGQGEQPGEKRFARLENRIGEVVVGASYDLCPGCEHDLGRWIGAGFVAARA